MSRKYAAIFCDYQVGIAGFLSASEDRSGNAGASLQRAREDPNALIIHVRVAFRPGRPELSSANKFFGNIFSRNPPSFLIENDDSASFLPHMSPLPAEIVITKTRVSAATGTPLQQVLIAHDIRKVQICGFSTSGVVLSTVRWLSDADYQITVLASNCGDPDPETHRFLVEKVFPRQADVVCLEKL